MASQRCWSSIVAGSADRAALRLAPGTSSLLACELADGHSGLHASDGGRGSAGRRPWLLWGDAPGAGRSCRDIEACAGRDAGGRPCVLFAGHDGMHAFPVSRVPAAGAPPAAAPPHTPRHEAGPRNAEPRIAEPRIAEPEPRVAEPEPRIDEPPAAESAPEPPVAADAGITPIDAMVRDTARGPIVSPDLPRVPSPVTFGPNGRGGAVVDTGAAPVGASDGVDPYRTSLVEVIGLDGSARTVVAPVLDAIEVRYAETEYPVPQAAAGTPPADLVPAGPDRSAAAVTQAASEAVAAAAQTLASIPGDPPPANHEVGEALRDLAAALTRLADGLDPH